MLALAAVLLCVETQAAERSHPVDCFPDAVVVWQAAEPSPELRFGAASLPGIVLGPPGDSIGSAGSTSVASLGNGGSAVISFTDAVIEDGPGPDFIIFENAFFVGAPPVSETASFFVFAEPGIVEVSADGASWTAFPFDPNAVAAATGQVVEKDLLARLGGLAGVTPTFTGNWTVADDPALWDPNGVGGVSGAGGDAFDLASVGLTQARFIRITDAETGNGAAGAAEGFDLDAIVILNGRPRPAPGTDADNDRLGDGEEAAVYVTSASSPDTDGDGADDGREVAGCRDPGTAAASPWWMSEPRLWVRAVGCTEVSWSFAGSGAGHDLIRGRVSELSAGATDVDLGMTTCLADDHLQMVWSCDASVPPWRDGFFYLVRAAGGYGRSSSLAARTTTADCP